MSAPAIPAPSAAEVKERLKDALDDFEVFEQDDGTGDYVECRINKDDLTAALSLIERGELVRERVAQLEKKLNHFTDATTKPHSLDDATMREWDLANELAKLRALLAGVKEHHARGLEHVNNQERTLTEYAKEAADLRAQLAAATERVRQLEKDKERLDYLDGLKVRDAMDVVSSQSKMLRTIRHAIDAARAPSGPNASTTE